LVTDSALAYRRVVFDFYVCLVCLVVRFYILVCIIFLVVASSIVSTNATDSLERLISVTSVGQYLKYKYLNYYLKYYICT